MRYVSLLVLTLGFAAQAQAFTPNLSGLDELPVHTATASVATKKNVVPRKGIALEFARAVQLPVTLHGGRWQQIDAETWSWRTRIFSSGAAAMNFEFSEFQMPEGGELWIYDTAGQRVQGPYTAANHTPEGMLWTAIVGGDSAVIEARVPAARRDELRLQLGQIQHGEKDFLKDGLFGNAGSCNIDVACNQGAAWTNEARATVLLESRGAICSGVLINNTRADNTPLVLTADHCEIRASGAHPASSVVVYWQYQNAACNGNSSNADASKSQSGATFLATDAASDFTLLRLNQAPAANFNVYYAGWDVTSLRAQSGVGLHHPRGDVKKVSSFTMPVTSATLPMHGTDVSVWEVQRWASGVTEPGSSGSGLWNQNRQLVGLLTGGSSQCTVDNSDPTNPLGPAQPDYYGRLDVAYARGLKSFIDPNNTGVTTLCGRNPGSVSCGTAPAATSGGSGGGAIPIPMLFIFLMAAMSAGANSRRASHA